VRAARIVGAALLAIAALSPLAQAAGAGPGAAASAAVAPGKSGKPGTVFRDCADCPEMVVIPPGRFTMGVDGSSWADPVCGRPIRDDEPVARIRWSDAKSYVSWLAGKTGKKYRLLTESEWEYVARAGTTGTHTWSEDAAAACKYANIHDQSAEKMAAEKSIELPYGKAPCDDGYPVVAPVGKFAPNAFGLYDTIGNVWEWVEDCHEMPYPAKPVDGSAQLAKGCDRRGTRGGSWRTDYPRQRPAFRGRDPEALTSQIFGTRVARDLEEKLGK